MEAVAHEHDLGRRVRSPKRLERGEREDEVAERVGSDDGDLAHCGHSQAFVRDTEGKSRLWRVGLHARVRSGGRGD